MDRIDVSNLNCTQLHHTMSGNVDATQIVQSYVSL